MQCLADMGLHGYMLSCIVSMYWQAPMQPKLGNNLGQQFNSTRGVKQGDPLSPLLFGVFFDRIEKWLSERLPSCGVAVGDRLVRVLLYADDLALLASSAVDLQRLLNALRTFCQEFHMEVNIGKTEIVVFGYSKYRGSARWWIRDRGGVAQQVPVSQQFKYLGVIFHETKGMLVAVDALGTAGRRAMWAMMTQCKDRGFTCKGLQVQLFNSLVSPILCYCSEVWGPTMLHSEAQGSRRVDHVLDNDLSRVQTLFCRLLAGKVRKSTPRQVLLREFGCHPLARMWLRSMLGFWNRVTTMPHSELLRIAMQENASLCFAAVRKPHMRKHLWYYRFRGILRYLDAHNQRLAEALAAVDQCRRIESPSLVFTAFDAWFCQRWQGLPANPRDQSVPSEQILYCTYERWFARVPVGQLDMSQPATWCPRIVTETAGIHSAHATSLLRLRLGAHDLGIAAGRWAGVARQDRLCGRCNAGLPDDEFHMVFECSHYDAIRSRFSCLFASQELQSPVPEGTHMSTFIHQNATLVAAFVHACWLQRCNGVLDPIHVLSLADIQNALTTADDHTW